MKWLQNKLIVRSICITTCNQQWLLLEICRCFDFFAESSRKYAKVIFKRLHFLNLEHVAKLSWIKHVLKQFMLQNKNKLTFNLGSFFFLLGRNVEWKKLFLLYIEFHFLLKATSNAWRTANKLHFLEFSLTRWVICCAQDYQRSVAKPHVRKTLYSGKPAHHKTCEHS